MTPKYLRVTRRNRHFWDVLTIGFALCFGVVFGLVVPDAPISTIIGLTVACAMLGAAAYAGSQATYHCGRRDGLIEAQKIVNGEQRGGYFKMPADIGGQW